VTAWNHANEDSGQSIHTRVWQKVRWSLVGEFRGEKKRDEGGVWGWRLWWGQKQPQKPDGDHRLKVHMGKGPGTGGKKDYTVRTDVYGLQGKAL